MKVTSLHVPVYDFLSIRKDTAAKRLELLNFNDLQECLNEIFYEKVICILFVSLTNYNLILRYIWWDLSEYAGYSIAFT